MKRHCSCCGLPGHDKRRCRRNPDFFTDPNGVIHPMRKDKHGDNDHRSPKERQGYSERVRAQKRKGSPATEKAKSEATRSNAHTDNSHVLRAAADQMQGLRGFSDAELRSANSSLSHGYRMPKAGMALSRIRHELARRGIRA